MVAPRVVAVALRVATVVPKVVVVVVVGARVLVFPEETGPAQPADHPVAVVVTRLLRTVK